MATFNTNISEADVSKLLKGKSLKSSTKNFLKKCAKAESDVALFKSCTGMAAKSIDTMYTMVGVVILGIKNKNANSDVKKFLTNAKITLGQFFKLVYAGNGQKICSYLDSASGQWFRGLISALLTTNKDKDIYKRFYKKVKSIKMASKVIRKLFSKSLENLKGLILAVCPGLEKALSWSYQREADADSYTQTEERLVLKYLASIRSNGKKIPSSLRHKIVVNIYPDSSPVWQKLSGPLSIIWRSEGGQAGKQNLLYFRGRSLGNVSIIPERPLVFIVKKREAALNNKLKDIANAIFKEFEKYGMLEMSSKQLRAERAGNESPLEAELEVTDAIFEEIREIEEKNKSGSKNNITDTLPKDTQETSRDEEENKAGLHAENKDEINKEFDALLEEHGFGKDAEEYEANLRARKDKAGLKNDIDALLEEIQELP